jgi:hypothetical protein
LNDFVRAHPFAILQSTIKIELGAGVNPKLIADIKSGPIPQWLFTTLAPGVLLYGHLRKVNCFREGKAKMKQ